MVRILVLATVLIGLGGLGAGAAGPTLQRTADEVSPPPERAGKDRGRLHADGCMVDQRELRHPLCVYGKRASDVTVVLFGDSQAMQWFPPLLRVARERGWRLVGRTRAGCPPAAVKFARRCDAWRAGALERIERRDRPDLVVIASGPVYRPVRGGRRLVGAARERVMAAGFARTLRRLARTGAPVAVMKTTPWAPRFVPGCVARSLDRLRRCAFSPRQPTNSDYDARGAARVPAARLVDAKPRLCRPRLCPAVIDDRIVYRDAKHLSATFARTLAGWLSKRLPEPR